MSQEADADEGGTTVSYRRVSRFSRMTRWVATTVMLALVAGAITAFVVLSGRASKGKLYVDAWMLGSERDIALQLPNAQLSLGFTTGGDSLSVGGDELKPPLNGELLEVDWHLYHQPDRLPGGVATTGNVLPELTLNIAGRRTVIPTDFSTSVDRSGRVGLAVDDVKDVAVEVTFDGKRFTLRPDGSMSPATAEFRQRALASRPRPAPSVCPSSYGRPGAVLQRWYISCAFPIVRSEPYIAGLGWAPAGRTWLITDPASILLGGDLTWVDPKGRGVDDSRAHRVAYESEKPPSGSVTVDGARPAKTLPNPAAAGRPASTQNFFSDPSVFDVPIGKPVEVEITVTFVGEFSWADDGATGYPQSVSLPVTKSFFVTAQ